MQCLWLNEVFDSCFTSCHHCEMFTKLSSKKLQRFATWEDTYWYSYMRRGHLPLDFAIYHFQHTIFSIHHEYGGLWMQAPLPRYLNRIRESHHGDLKPPIIILPCTVSRHTSAISSLWRSDGESMSQECTLIYNHQRADPTAITPSIRTLGIINLVSTQVWRDFEHDASLHPDRTVCWL